MLLGIDGVLTVFVPGATFDTAVGGRERAAEENVQEAVNQFFTLPVFVLFGLMLSWARWRALGGAGLALVAAVLPALLLRPLVPALADRRDAAYAG